MSDIGEWVLFTSPTPFNRFVMLRCPSIAVPGSELLENVSESLVKEERHLVRINSGRIQVRKSEENCDEKLVYQRLCVRMEDGGVVSLDWPANLDLEEERGLDTTFLIVPGTVEGSMDKDIRGFVCDCLRRGCFPVVMNPRGCAGSPLTTARSLFLDIPTVLIINQLIMLSHAMLLYFSYLWILLAIVTVMIYNLVLLYFNHD